MKTCDGCGNIVRGGIGIGGALLCRLCADEVSTTMDRLRRTGKPVNAIKITRRLYREKNKPVADYHLRDIPAAMMAEMKHRALDEGGSVRGLIITAVAQYLAGKPRGEK